jgi:ATP-dependent Clp protease ATP-binding subunit ClpB
VMNQLRANFRPEFLNRIDEIVLFEPLTQAHITSVVDLQLARLRALLTEKRLTLELSEGARTFLAKEGYDPIYGARPLKRAIQRHLQDPLALKILGGEFTPGDAIRAEVAGEGLRFTAAARA